MKKQFLNQIIRNDFHKLLNILYRIDVSENKVRIALEKNKNGNSGAVIANLLIERENEKMKYRKWYKAQEEKNE